jgi:hypothetical protein
MRSSGYVSRAGEAGCRLHDEGINYATILQGILFPRLKIAAGLE